MLGLRCSAGNLRKCYSWLVFFLPIFSFLDRARRLPVDLLARQTEKGYWCRSALTHHRVSQSKSSFEHSNYLPVGDVSALPPLACEGVAPLARPRAGAGRILKLVRDATPGPLHPAEEEEHNISTIKTLHLHYFAVSR